MKKEVIVINIHSFVDVITNSSSELFACDTDKSVKMVYEILKELDLHNEFDYPYILTQEMYDEAVEEAKESMKLYKKILRKQYLDFVNNRKPETKWFNREETARRLKKISEDDYYVQHLDYHMKEENIGRIILMNKDENFLINDNKANEIKRLIGPFNHYYPV